MRINSNRLNKIRYTFYAPIYDGAAKILEHSRARAIQQLAVQQGDKVLIIGAGTGMDLNYLPKGCQITATDITPAMVKRIDLRNQKMGHHLTTAVMDGQQLAFPNEKFDVVILHLILTVIPDPIRTIQEAERVLKSGGQISVFDKFVPGNKTASIIRKAFNVFTNLFFSNITRSFEPIVAHTRLITVSDKKANLGGFFRILLLRK
ncbi:MAG: class I SAM-dependent methyltransferase [Prolixibacteraceae bacterium]